MIHAPPQVEGRQPAGRRPAPPPLDLIQDFANTIIQEWGVDEFATRESLAAWLATRKLIETPGNVSDDDVRLTVDMRTALRRILVSHHDLTEPDPDTIAVLDRIGAGGRLRFGFEPALELRSVAGGVQAAIDHLLVIVYRAQIGGNFHRLKVCNRESCRWAFYDASKNRGGKWCSMSICGNREKAGRHRRRQPD